MRTILIATDGSPAAEAAVEAGFDLAAESRGHAVVVHVTDPLDPTPTRSGERPSRPRGLPAAEDVPSLAAAAALADERGIECRTRLVAGVPDRAILAVADELDADLIVVGSRGDGALAQAGLGSVPTGLARRSNRPVLVVHAARERVEAGAAAEVLSA